jgi:hypothetical protein
MPHRANGSYVSNADALTAWTPVARAALLETARGYRAVLAPDALAARVQSATGIATEQPVGDWLGRLLDRVAAEAVRRDEPPLAALCIVGSDSDEAAEARLRCYRAYADDLPADGGSPARVARAAPVRRSAPARTPRSSTPARREVTCPSCWMIVAAHDTCTSCGAPLPAA